MLNFEVLCFDPCFIMKGDEGEIEKIRAS